MPSVARYRNVTVDPDPIHIRVESVLTAAGITSALDATLALVEEDHGAEPARQIARDAVTYLQRPGSKAQMNLFTTTPPPNIGVVRRATEHVLAHVDGDLSTARLAEVAGVSARHLTRLFLDHVGHTPGHYIRRARIDAAARLLATTRLSMPEVAGQCGFGTGERSAERSSPPTGSPDTLPSHADSATRTARAGASLIA